MEQLRDVYIAHNIVDVLPEDHNLAQAGAGEGVYELMACCGLQIHSDDFVARRHALAQLRCLEVEGILEYLDLIFHFAVVRILVY